MIERSHNKIRVLVAESFELVRIGLRALFKNHSSVLLTAETNSIEDLFKLAMQHNPDVILIDLKLSGDKYTEHISKLLHICPQSKILAFHSTIASILICKHSIPVQYALSANINRLNCYWKPSMRSTLGNPCLIATSPSKHSRPSLIPIHQQRYKPKIEHCCK